MRLIFFSMMSLLILSSCQSIENPEGTSENTEETTAEYSDESTNNNEASEEKTSKEPPDTNEYSEAPTEESANNEKEEEGTASTEESNDNVSNQAATSFDIHSDEVQQALFDSESVKTENLTFSQDVITKGMSQSEIEAQYGPYDFVYPGHGRPVVIYGNLGVVYSESFPYGTDDEHAKPEIDPDENTVLDVLFYADLTYDEVIDALGPPDVDIYEREGGPVEGLQVMEYEIEDKANSTVIGTFRLHDDESGEKIVDLLTIDEIPDDAEDITFEESQEAEVMDETKERIELFVDEYIDDLMGYYNNGDEAILLLTSDVSPNYEKISANRDSGNYRNHKTYDIEVKDITHVEYNEYKVTVRREYEHVSSNGRRVTEVNYVIFEGPQGFLVHDYRETDNEPID